METLRQVREGEELGGTVSAVRRWRGTINVPPTNEGLAKSWNLGSRLQLDAIYHDSLSRCDLTASALRPNVLFEAPEAGPWNMGELFEGREITEDSLKLAAYYVNNPYGCPPKGEPFHDYYYRWMSWIRELKIGFAAVGVVTHNRNIQTVYAQQYDGKFKYHMYDCHGPEFLSVHYFDRRRNVIEPWGGNAMPLGLYLVRHCDTSWGT